MTVQLAAGRMVAGREVFGPDEYVVDDPGVGTAGTIGDALRSSHQGADRPVLGLGGCVDYELRVSGPGLERLVERYAITVDELTVESAVSSERELVVSMLRHLANGTGGEYRVDDLAVLTTFAARFDPLITLGGSSVRAALVMSQLGVPSLLHLVCFNEHFERLLPDDVDYRSSGYDGAVFPHLIVQYDAGLTVRVGDLRLTAPFPNRLIYVNDPANETLAIREDLGSMLASTPMFLITGFNAINTAAVLSERLATVRRHMQQLPPDALVYYEDAAFHQPEFSRLVRDALLDAVTIYGLNEDELQGYLGRPVDLRSVSEVRTALAEVHALIPARTVVVHTKYWAAAVGSDSARYAGALDQGMVAATTRYRRGDDFTDTDLAATRALERRPAGSAFAAELERAADGMVCCRPAFQVEVAEPTTVGLGDTFVGGFLAALASERVAGR